MMRNIPLYITGGGRIADGEINSYADKVKPIPVDGQLGYPVQYIPKKMVLSKEIGKTVYDVTADFDTDGKQSLLQQFMQLILEQPHI